MVNHRGRRGIEEKERLGADGEVSMSKDFFKKQEPITALKTKIYEKYITGYLPKLLMQFGRCMMFDLFCGPGKNGKEKGSPLILMDQLEYILSSPQIHQRKDLRVDVFFNDQEKSFVDNLEKELSALNYDRSTVHVQVTRQCCKGVLPGFVDRYGSMAGPKFFFLDPFTYSDIRMGD
jgi:three-Cys-motif partner protein